MSRNKHESMTRRPCSRHRQPTAALGRGCVKTMRIASVASVVWRHIMARYVEGLDRRQSFLLPDSIQDCVGEDNPVRVIDVFVDRIDLSELGFGRAVPADTGRPGYHPATLLKLYLYGYLNSIPSSRRLEREAQSESGADVADQPPRSGLQDDRRLPSRQWCSDSWDMPAVCDAVPANGPVVRGDGCD